MNTEKINNIPKRQICLRANVHFNTLNKFLNNKPLTYTKELKIKVAIASLLKESKEIDLELSKK